MGGTPNPSTMDYRSLDITVISASGLKNVNTFTKMRVYVVVSLINGDIVSTKKTHVSNGGCNPTWSHRLRFSIKDSAIATATLLFVLRCRHLFKDRDIGEVSIPVADLLNTANGYENTEHVVEYLVRRFIQGKARGTLTFSHQLRNTIQDSGSQKPAGEDSVNSASCPPGMMYGAPYPQPQPQPQGCGSHHPYAGVPYGGGWYPQPVMGVYQYAPHAQQMGYQNMPQQQQQPQQQPEVKG